MKQIYDTLHLIFFLPDESADAQKVIDDIKESAKTIEARAVDIIRKIFRKNITQLQESYAKPEDDKNRVSLETVIGRNKNDN